MSTDGMVPDGRRMRVSLRYLPLRPGTNLPAIKEWQHRASADPYQWREWRQEIPRCNWGLLTGDGVGVLDLDTKNAPTGDPGGFGPFIDVEEILGIDLSNLPLVATASGVHLYFRYDGSLPSKIGWFPHFDVIADGGRFVAAPGTKREVDGDEKDYTLLRGSLEDIPFAPETLIEAIRQWRSASRGGSSGGGTSADLPPTNWLREHGFRLGGRDNGFNTLAWRLVRTHYPHMDLVRQIAWDVWDCTDNPDNDLFPWKKVEDQIARAVAQIGPDVEAHQSWAASIRSMK